MSSGNISRPEALRDVQNHPIRASDIKTVLKRIRRKANKPWKYEIGLILMYYLPVSPQAIQKLKAGDIRKVPYTVEVDVEGETWRLRYDQNLVQQLWKKVEPLPPFLPVQRDERNRWRYILTFFENVKLYKVTWTHLYMNRLNRIYKATGGDPDLCLSVMSKNEFYRIGKTHAADVGDLRKYLQ